MSDERKPKLLIIDENSRTTRISREELPPGPKVVELDPEQIAGFDIKIAMNGGYAAEVCYSNGRKPDMLVFQNKKELLLALGNLLKE